MATHLDGLSEVDLDPVGAMFVRGGVEGAQPPVDEVGGHVPAAVVVVRPDGPAGLGQASVEAGYKNKRTKACQGSWVQIYTYTQVRLEA